VSVLRAAGHAVRAIAEDHPGAADLAVLALARVERRVLLTSDKDFAELVFRQRRVSFGLVLLRLRDWNAEQKAERLLEVLAHRPELRGVLLVVTPRGVRRRTLIEPD
jgi:predicted nuclease of predicted toxin-antitoxin system